MLSFIFLISYFLSLFFLFFFIPFSFILSPFVPFCFSFSALSRVSERVLIPNLSQRSYDASLTLLIKVSSLPDDESSSLTSLRSDMLPGRLIRNLLLYFSSQEWSTTGRLNNIAYLPHALLCSFQVQLNASVLHSLGSHLYLDCHLKRGVVYMSACFIFRLSSDHSHSVLCVKHHCERCTRG